MPFTPYIIGKEYADPRISEVDERGRAKYETKIRKAFGRQLTGVSVVSDFSCVSEQSSSVTFTPYVISKGHIEPGLTEQGVKRGRSKCHRKPNNNNSYNKTAIACETKKGRSASFTPYLATTFA